MITDKTKQAIQQEAKVRAEYYDPVEPWDMNTTEQDHFKYGFEQGALWATKKMSDAILKAINK